MKAEFWFSDLSQPAKFSHFKSEIPFTQKENGKMAAQYPVYGYIKNTVNVYGKIST